MSRLLDVLRHAEDTRPAPDSRPGAATQRHPPSELALEPIARKTSAAPEPISANGTAPPAPHHQVACPSPASPSRSARIRAFLPGLAGAVALAGLAFGIWLELQPLARVLCGAGLSVLVMFAATAVSAQTWEYKSYKKSMGGQYSKENFVVGTIGLEEKDGKGCGVQLYKISHSLVEYR